MNSLRRIAGLVLVLHGLASAVPAAMTLGQAKLGNVFFSTETVSFPLSGMTGTSVSWTATDYFGAIVGSGTVSVGSGAATIEPDIGRRGWFELHLRELNGASLVSEKKTTFAVVSPITVAGMSDSPFGAQTHFAQSTPAAIMPLLARAGIAHFRDEQYWDNIESPAGTYTYPAKFTNYMSVAAAEQIQPLITLDWTNRYYDFEAGQFTGPHTDNGRLGYANYALNLLDRYGSQVKFVEVWNEYNAGTFIKGPATANKSLYYHLMLKQTYEAIKAARPDVQVLAGATVPIAHGFFRNIFEQGAMPYLDAVSVHPYRGYAEGVDLELAELQDLIRSYNGGEAKPIWASEFSLNVDTAAKQKPGAAYLARIVTLMRLANVERMYYYLMQDDGSFPYRGLLQSSSSSGGPYVPNPAYVAYATSIRKLYGWTPVARVTGTAGTTHVYRFTKDGETLHVLWANAPTTVSLATASEVTVTELMGQESILSPNGGQVSLALTSDVIYVKGPVTAVTEGVNPVVADSIDNYSKTQSDRGWSYGYADLASDASYSPGDFQPMSWGIFQSDNTRWLGTSTFHFMGQGNAHPASAWAIRRWVSDRNAPMRLTGTAVRGSGGDGVGLRIFVDGVEVHTAYLNPDTSANYDVTAAVNVGSTIDFAITQGLANNTNDSTSFTARITDLSAWTQPPTAPAALAASSGDLQVTLGWTGSTVATGYHVKRATISGGPYTTIASTTGMTYTDTTLEDATMYHYVVTAMNAYGESTASNEAAVLAQVRPVASASQQQTPNETADKAFDGLTNTKWYTGGAGSPRTAWLQYFFGARGTIAKTVIRYDLTSANDSPTRDPRDWQFQGSHNGVDWVTLDTRTGQSFSARFQTKQYAVSNSTAYPYYRLNITANNGATNGIQVAELAFVYPVGEPPAGAPGDLTATARAASIELSWTSVPGATSYHVKRGAASGGPYSTIAAGVSGLIYHDTTGVGNTTYHYVVSAANAGGEGPLSNEASATAPVVPVAAASQQQTPNETADKAFDGLATTKWYTGGAGAPTSAWLQYHFGGGTSVKRIVVRYDLTSANDSATRDPRDWQFQGSNDGTNWTTLDTQTGQLFTARFQTQQYPINNDAPYAYYRLNITANNGATTGIQLAELAFTFGQATPALAWEPPATITYGTALSAAQLNATASVPGAFVYTPPAGTVLGAGPGQPLGVAFTPSDLVNYTPATTATVITVEKAPASIVLGSLVARYDGAAKPVSVETLPSDLATSVTYEGQPVPPVYPGEYDVEAVIIDPNHAGAASDTLVITTTALVRHAPTLSGILDGSVQVLRPESVTLKETTSVSGDLLVPGRPAVVTKADPALADAITLIGPGSSSPSTHTITVNTGAVVRYVVVQVDAIDLPEVPAPAAPAGTRSVTLSKPGQSAGDFSTLRNLTLNGGAGTVAVAPGAYGHFIANGGTGFVLGVPGATEPARYDFQSLALNGASTLQVVGPVIVTLANGTTLNGEAGDAEHPAWLTLEVKSGGLTLNTGATFDGHVIAPDGTVTINEHAALRGSVASDRLTLNGNGLLADPSND